MRIGQVDVVPVMKETYKEFTEDDMTGMAAETAYRLVFALPPLLIFFVSLSALVDRYTGVDVFGQLMELAEDAAPGPVASTLDIVFEGIQDQAGVGALLSFGFIVAIWSASNAVDAMIKGFNRAYDVDEPRGFVKRKLTAIGLMIGLSVLVISSFVLFVFGGTIGEFVANQAGLGATFEAVWNILRWPILIALFITGLAILYWKGPAVNQTFRWISPGSVVATALWLVATLGMSIYLQFADPGSAYGALGSLVILLFFLYVSSIVLLLGAEINAVLAKNYDPATIKDKAEHPERQTEDPRKAQQRAVGYANEENVPASDVGVTAGTRNRADLERQRAGRAEPIDPGQADNEPPRDDGADHTNSPDSPQRDYQVDRSEERRP